MLWLLNLARAAEITTNLPGPYDVAKTGPVGFIANFYYFALGFGGLLAFGSIVYAGIKWTASQGNPGTISDAKDQIVQALWGLVLLGGAFVILNTINPELTVLNIPKLTEVSTSTSGGGGMEQLCGSPDTTQPGACGLAGQECVQKDCSTGAATAGYHCCARSTAVWVCNAPDVLDEYGNIVTQGGVKWCTKPVSQGGSGESGCNTQCHAQVGAATNCVSAQDTGQCAGNMH